MALVKTMKWFGALALLTTCFACSELDPVNVESLCEPPGPVHEQCPQCQMPPFAAECPQCQQSGVDEETCEPAPTSMSEEGAEGQPNPDGGPSGTGGDGAPDPGDGSSGNDGSQGPGNDGSMGTGGNGSTPPEGNAGKSGSDGSAQGGSPGPGNRPPGGCTIDDDCKDPMFPACRPDGLCTPCLTNDHCGEGLQCDRPTNRCVQCVDAAGCEAIGQVCDVNTRSCVPCLGNSDCKDPAAPACTVANQCVACTDDTFCPDGTKACDQNVCYECKADNYCAGPGKHACIEDEHRCVECEQDSHCRSEAGRPHCLVEGNSCVECLTNSDCSDPSASRCDADTHTCVDCAAATDCSAFAATAPRCVSGDCVACDGDDGICNGKACILSQNVCSDKDRRSVEACSECVTSDECVEGHVCVNMKFGSYDTGNFCLPNLPSFRACPRPYGREIANYLTLDGFRVRTLCALPENTTCQALLDTLADKVCNDNNALCGLGRAELGTNDGLCPNNVCTYNCSEDKFCPNGMVCSSEQAICL